MPIHLFGDPSFSLLDASTEARAILTILAGDQAGLWFCSIDEAWIEFSEGLAIAQKHPNPRPQHLTCDALLDEVHPDDRESLRLFFTEPKTDDPPFIHFRLRDRDHTWRWIELNRSKIQAVGGRAIGTFRDVTETKEKKLLTTNIQHIAAIGGWELDLKTQKTRWTDETYHIHAVPLGTSTDKIMGIEFYPPNERPRLMRAIEKCTQGKPYRETFGFTDQNGVFKYVEVTGEPVYNAEGSIVALRGTFQDVTRRETIERQFEEAQKVARIGNWSFDLNTQAIFWSDQMFQMFPNSIEDGPPSYEEHQRAIHPDDLPVWKKAVERCLTEGTPYSIRFRSLRSETETLWVEALGQAIRDHTGKVIGLRGTCQDVTDRIRLEDEYRLVLESVQTGVWRFYPKENKLYWDHSMYELFEIDPSSFSGEYEAWEHALTPESKQATVPKLEAALRGEAEFDTSFEIRTPTGKIKTIGARGKVFRNGTGDATLMVGVNWDRSREADLERQLKVEQAKALHASKLASLGEMSAGVAHEINNPLAIISGNAQLLIGILKTQKNVVEKLKAIDRSVERIARIVSGLKRFSRTSKFSDPVLARPVDIVHESLVLIDPKAKRHLVQIIPFLQSTASIICDTVEVEQVIINLVHNAIDAATHAADRWVEIRLFDTDHEVVLEVVDSGPGIPIEAEKNLFQPFYTTKAPGEGTGLGLSITKGILDQMKAAIELDRKECHTTFRIKFKRATGATLKS